MESTSSSPILAHLLTKQSGTPTAPTSEASATTTSTTPTFSSQPYTHSNQILERPQVKVLSAVRTSTVASDCGLTASGASSTRGSSVISRSASDPEPKKSSGRSKVCAVCGFVSATFHLSYGASACLSCRAFFRRIVNKGKAIMRVLGQGIVFTRE